MRGKKRTGGEQYRVCQKYVQDFGEWYATVCQRKLIDQAKLEQITFPGQESIDDDDDELMLNVLRCHLTY